MNATVYITAALISLLFVVAGCVLLWTSGQVGFAARGAGRAVAARVLAGIGWVVLVIGFCVGIVLMTGGLAIILIPAAIVVLVITVMRHRSTERRSLVWALTASAERGIPLETAARAFAAERTDVIGVRALNLAEYLEAGLPLSLALRRSGNPLPASAMLAADLGQQMGAMEPGLRHVVAGIEEYESPLRLLIETIVYLLILMAFEFMMVSFLMLKIVPVFAQMFEEFDLSLPGVTVLLINASSIFVSYWFLLFPLFAVLLVLLLFALLDYAGLGSPNLPLVGRFQRRSDGALIMRWIAISTGQGRSIADGVRLLSGYFPRRSVRVRLARALEQINGGAPWCASLQKAGLIRRPERAVLESAERAGNLAWALDEMADSSVRRSAYRLRAFANIAFPVVVIALGATVFFVAVGMMMPLFDMIQGLS